MHDPYTLIGSFGIGRRIDVQLWHRDRGGRDGACGWSFPNITDKQRKSLQNLAWWEAHDPYYMRSRGKTFVGGRNEGECLYRALVLQVARAIGVPMSFDEAAKFASERFHIGGCEDPSKIFCFLPGWHTNYSEDRQEDRREVFGARCRGIARQILEMKRPWYRHPRWHFWHWHLHVNAFGWSFGGLK